MKIVVSILGFLLLASCTSNTILEKPKHLIPEDKMVDILTDLFLATGAKSVKNIHGKRQINYMNLVFEKHHIDSTVYKESNYYYTSLIDANTAMLSIVERRLNKIKDSLNTIEKEMDSIKMKLSIDRRDSLRKKKGMPVLRARTSRKPSQIIEHKFTTEIEK
ncbi:MAG: DUF4296 domain-containing protein [Flavobacteriaceae bacterium]|nr:DUF4296 domain-containing protein [Flavobacteriaceae bacterium]